MKKTEIKRYIPSIVAVIVFIIIIIVLLFIKKSDVNNKKFNLNEVSSNYVVNDLEIMMLYNRFQVEDGLLFNLVGSNGYEDYYGHYYRENIDKLPSFLKNIVLAKDADYKTWDYDEDARCYRLSFNDYDIIYDKLFNDGEMDFTIDEEYKNIIMVNDDGICVSDNINSSYNKVIDTFLVNSIKKDDKIVIYERVVFIEIKDDYLYFYKDYGMKNLVYKLKNTKDVDISFINSSELVSNVLLEYQDKLDIYEYTYKKGVDTYYLESIKK